MAPTTARSSACPRCRRTSCRRIVVGDVGANPAQYGNQGILLNSDALKNWLFGPLDGPPRNTAQIGDAGMTRSIGTLIKFAVFGVVMVVLTAFLFVVFGEYENRCDERLFGGLRRCVAAEAGRHASGSRAFGSAPSKDVSLQADRKVLVKFDADRNIKLTTGTKAAVRYLNLVGDRYLELVDTPGRRRSCRAGSQIPVDRTAPALDLDLLLGGLKPVIQGLNPQDVNALTASLVQILQGQGGTLDSLFSQDVVVHEFARRQQPGRSSS